MTPTNQQSAIAASVLDRHSGHLQVIARAGTGKTTTMVWCAKQYWDTYPGSRILCLAFGAETQKAMETKLDEAFGRRPSTVIARTSHAIGLRIIRDHLGPIAIDKDRARKMAIKLYGKDCQQEVLQSIVGIYELILQTVPDKYEYDTILRLCTDYNLEIVEPDTTIACALDLLNSCRHDMAGTVSFGDMLDLPIYHQWRCMPPFDLIFVDESQDLNRAQHFLLPLLMHEHSKLVAIGDPCQAIYRFRGAHPDSMRDLSETYQMSSLPLSVTFRCPPIIVDCVKDLVPDYASADANKHGTVQRISIQDFRMEAEAGDLVLCRTNAPLVQETIRLMRDGNACYIKGRDISTSIMRLLDGATHLDLAERVGKAITRLQAEAAILENEGNKSGAAMKMDMVQIMTTLATEFTSYEQVRRYLSTTFREGVGICFSTVHQAKGDEARSVYILREDLLPPPWVDRYDIQSMQDELNIRYVAITRASENLSWVE